MKGQQNKIPVRTTVRTKPYERTRTLRIVAILIAILAILLVLYAIQSNTRGARQASAAGIRCGNLTCEAVRTISMSTDRQSYRSRENMKMDITIESDIDSPVDLRLHGINSRGFERFNLQTRQELGIGRNILTMNYQLPSCTGCAGITPGNYTITAEAKAGNETKSADATIEIMQ